MALKNKIITSLQLCSVFLTLGWSEFTPNAVETNSLVEPAQIKGGVNEEERASLNSRWDLGYYLFQLQEYGAAAKEFEKIRQILPNDPVLLALIGSCHSLSGDWASGEKALLDAEARNPGDKEITGLLGQFYLSAGQSLKGAAYFEHSLRITSNQPELRARLANLYLDANQGERARYHLEILLEARFVNEGARMDAGFGNPDLDYDYARSLVQAGRFKEGLVYAELAHLADPENPRFARIYGLCLMSIQRYGDAARMLAAGHNELKGEEQVYLQWGEALFLDRNWENAEGVWREGVQRFPQSYDLMARLVEFYISTAKPAWALRVIIFGETRNPGHPGNLLLEAKMHRRMENYAAASKVLMRLKRQAFGVVAQDALWEEAQLDFATGKYADCERRLDHLVSFKHRKADALLLKDKLAMYRGVKSLPHQALVAHEGGNKLATTLKSRP